MRHYVHLAVKPRPRNLALRLLWWLHLYGWRVCGFPRGWHQVSIFQYQCWYQMTQAINFTDPETGEPDDLRAAQWLIAAFARLPIGLVEQQSYARTARCLRHFKFLADKPEPRKGQTSFRLHGRKYFQYRNLEGAPLVVWKVAQESLLNDPKLLERMEQGDYADLPRVLAAIMTEDGQPYVSNPAEQQKLATRFWHVNVLDALSMLVFFLTKYNAYRIHTGQFSPILESLKAQAAAHLADIKSGGGGRQPWPTLPNLKSTARTQRGSRA